MNKFWNKLKGWFKPKPVKKSKELTFEEQIILLQAQLKQCERLIEQLGQEREKEEVKDE